MYSDRRAGRGFKFAGQEILCIFWTYLHFFQTPTHNRHQSSKLVKKKKKIIKIEKYSQTDRQNYWMIFSSLNIQACQYFFYKNEKHFLFWTLQHNKKTITGWKGFSYSVGSIYKIVKEKTKNKIKEVKKKNKKFTENI